MISYAQHAEFLERELNRAQQALAEIVAETRGYHDAKYPSDFGTIWPTPRQRDRYQLGYQIGKMKLMMDEIESKHKEAQHA